MSESNPGQVVTFYSYKGGTGRTMALANVAWILASAGKRVLVADWDLESPGLHRFYKPFVELDRITRTGGVIDLVREFEDEQGSGPRPNRPADWIARFARVNQYAFSITWPDFPPGGTLDFLSAGRQNDDYAAALVNLDWKNFYANLHGIEFLDALRDDMRSRYDYTLIDSRTGFSDVSDICTSHLPDTLVDCFTLSDQGIQGAATVAHRVARSRVRPEAQVGRRRPIRILPVTMRVDQAEMERVEAGRMLARRSFPDLPAGMSEEERTRYFDRVEVPYSAYFAYEEMLATFGERQGPGNSLLAAYERLTAEITGGEVSSFRAMDEQFRLRWRRRFERPRGSSPTVIELRYELADQLWAEWIGDVLAEARVTVLDPGPAGIEPEAGERLATPAEPAQVLSIVSASSVAAREAVRLARPLAAGDQPRDRYRVHVASVDPADLIADEAISIAGLAPDDAAERIFELIGVPVPTSPKGRTGVRYPTSEPTWFQAPARNARFTGRTADLYKLRRELLLAKEAVVLPVAIEGMGGIGKTQLAMEYVHRFKAAYDLVWWIHSDPPGFIDVALADLGRKLGLPSERTPVDSARTTLNALRQGQPTDRWLLVFDNADEIDKVTPFLPEGNGHLLLTSRQTEWRSRARPVTVDVFKRTESIAHLRSRVASMNVKQADQVAATLDDLPIAVAVAGAWLAETGTPVETYLATIEQLGASASMQENWQPVQATWDLSLDRLRERSPGGYRLLQLCSVLHPETSLTLLYGDQMAEHLVNHDPTVSDRLMRGALVQQINRLALLKLDPQAGVSQVHRLLQDVVRNRMTSDELDATRHEAHLMLARSRPSGEVEDQDAQAGFRMLWPHLEACRADSCPDPAVRQLLIDRVRYLWHTGDLARGEEFGNQVAARWQARLARETSVPAARALRIQLLQLRFNIANILRSRAKYQESLAVDEGVLTQQTELLGERHSHTLMTAGSRAADLRALGRYAESLPLEQATFQTWNDAFGDEYPRTLAAANNLATASRAVGLYREAERLDRMVWTKRRLLWNDTHHYTLHSANCLGRDLRELGEYEQSVSQLRQTVKIARESAGTPLARRLSIQTNLAISLRSAGRAAEAAPLLEEALAAFLARFGPTHPETLACLLNRGANLLAMNQVDAALQDMVTVTDEYFLNLGEEHPLHLVCLTDQSAAHRARGDRAKAAELAERAALACARVLGLRHPYSLATAMNLASCEFDAGKPSEAAARTADLVNVMGEVLGRDHPDTLSCRVNLTILNRVVNSPSDGRGLAAGELGDSTELESLAQRLGRQHPSVLELRRGRPVYRVIDPHDPY